MDRYHCSSKYFLDERRSLGIFRFTMWKVYNEYNLSCSQRLWYLVWLMNKQDWRITHVQGGRQLRSFNIQIYKDLVFFLLLVGFMLRRGLISSLNSVAWFVPVKETNYISHLRPGKENTIIYSIIYPEADKQSPMFERQGLKSTITNRTPGELGFS